VILIASEAREFSGLERALGNVERRDWGIAYAAEGGTAETRFVMGADGAGGANARRAAERVLDETKSDILVSAGFCGGLDASLRPGDVVVAGRVHSVTQKEAAEGNAVMGVDHVVTTAAEKRRLREATGAAILDMESHELATIAEARGMRFLAIRVVSDGAEQDLPLDFNLARGANGSICAGRVAILALKRPLAIPALIRLARTSARASQNLGEFLAGYSF